MADAAYHPDTELTAVLGASRSGKTAWTRAQVARASRVIVWDSKREWCRWPEFIAVDSWAAWRAMLRPGGRYLTEPMRLAFVPPDATKQTFQAWAGAALEWAVAAPGVVVMEEVPDVVTPQRAEGGYSRLLRRGRGQGATIYVLSTSPAESDKTTLRNASRIHCCQLGFSADHKYVGNLLNVPADLVASLRPLDYLEGSGTLPIYRGRIEFNSRGLAYTRLAPVIVRA